MELTGNDENQVKAGPDKDREETNSMGILNWRFAQLCKVPTNMFYHACTILASELSEF